MKNRFAQKGTVSRVLKRARDAFICALRQGNWIIDVKEQPSGRLCSDLQPPAFCVDPAIVGSYSRLVMISTSRIRIQLGDSHRIPYLTIRANILLAWSAVLFLCFLTPSLCFAGPGGEIIEFAVRNPIGRIVLGIVAIILLPLILYVVIGESLGIRKTRQDLKRLAEIDPDFDWKTIETQVRKIVDQLYANWSTGDLTSLHGLLYPDYLTSQQDILDRWNEEEKRNVTELKKLQKIEPLHLLATDAEAILRIRIKLDLKDYLESIKTGEILKGSKSKVISDHEAIWSLILHEGTWQLFAIEKDDLSLSYAKAPNEIEPSLLRPATLSTREVSTDSAPVPETLTSQPAALHPDENQMPTEQEEPMVEVRPDHHDQRQPADDGQRRKEE